MGKLLELISWLGFHGFLILGTAVILIIIGIRAIVQRDIRGRGAFLIVTAIVYAAMGIEGMREVALYCGAMTIGTFVVGVILAMVTMKVIHREKIYAVPFCFIFSIALPFIVCGIGGLMAEEGYDMVGANMFHIYYWLQLIIMLCLQLCVVYEDRLPEGLQETIEDPIQHMTGDEY